MPTVLTDDPRRITMNCPIDGTQLMLAERRGIEIRLLPRLPRRLARPWRTRQDSRARGEENDGRRERSKNPDDRRQRRGRRGLLRDLFELGG